MNRRRGALLMLLVAAACGVGSYIATAPDNGEAEPSAAGSAQRSSVALAKAGADPKLPFPLPDVGEGPKPSAFSRPSRATDTPIAMMPELAEDVRRIATARLGVDHAVYVGRDSKGWTCVVLQEGAFGRGGGGCNPSRNPFLKSSVMWSSSAFNESPQKLVVYGVVAARVSAVRLTFDGDVETAVPLSDDGGFLYIVEEPEIKPGDVPEAIITLDSNGRVVERTRLGITFGS